MSDLELNFMDHLYIAELDHLGEKCRMRGRDGLDFRLKEFNMQ